MDLAFRASAGRPVGQRTRGVRSIRAAFIRFDATLLNDGLESMQTQAEGG